MSDSYFINQPVASTSIGVLSDGIWRIPHLAAFFPIAIRQLSRWQRSPPTDVAWVAAWGYRPSRRRVEHYATRHKLPILTIEDGFVRSIGLGQQGDAPMGLVLDDVGIYFDARRSSRLERLIAQGHDQTERAAHCMSLLRLHYLSGSV